MSHRIGSGAINKSNWISHRIGDPQTGGVHSSEQQAGWGVAGGWLPGLEPSGPATPQLPAVLRFQERGGLPAPHDAADARGEQLAVRREGDRPGGVADAAGGGDRRLRGVVPEPDGPGVVPRGQQRGDFGPAGDVPEPDRRGGGGGGQEPAVGRPGDAVEPPGVAPEYGRPPPQGQLPLRRCTGKDFEHEVLVPTAATAFHGDAFPARMLLE
jgi:hypothetical protein